MPGDRDPNTITWAEIQGLALLLFEADVQLDEASDAYEALADDERAAYRGRAQHLLRSGPVRMAEAGEFRTEWGIRWPDTGYVDLAANEEFARDAVTGKQATHYGAVAVSRRVSEWTEVSS